MPNLQTSFLQICVDNEILSFGEFTLKSGRISPYFFNAGKFNDGLLLAELSRSFAELLVNNVAMPYMLYGPAYKGIPLVAATAVQLHQLHGQTVGYAFNRKEVKDHGEGGTIVGAELSGNIVIMDDVITAGTSVNESVEILRHAGATPCCIVIALDREEIADGEALSATQKTEDLYGIPVYSLIKLSDLTGFIADNDQFMSHLPAIQQYQNDYGTAEIT